VDSSAHRIDETLVRVRREIHGDRGARRNGAGDLDVQHHLAVRPVRRPGAVAPAIDRDGDNGWLRHPELREVCSEICLPEAAAQLDQCNALATSSQSCRKRVGRGNLRRRVRRSCIRSRTELGAGLRTRVEAEHTGHNLHQLGWHREAPLTGSILHAVGVLVHRQCCAEGSAQRTEGTGELDASAGEVDVASREPMSVGECSNGVDIAR
jgi:hypothetical protein